MPPVLISTCSILLLLGLLEASIATDQATAASQAVPSGTPAIQIVSPSSGQTLTTDDVALAFAVEDFTVDCTQSGRPEQVGVGHIHVMLDGLLVNWAAKTPSASPATDSSRVRIGWSRCSRITGITTSRHRTRSPSTIARIIRSPFRVTSHWGYLARNWSARRMVRQCR
jgi:hypothetical protein